MRGKVSGLLLVFALVAGGAIVGNPHVSEAQEPAAPSAAAAGDPAAPEALKPYVLPDTGPFNPKSLSPEQTKAIADWHRSGHSDAKAEAFTHWDAEGAVPPVCSVCHSGAGFRSFHGLDGSKPGLPEKPLPTGGVVDCETCHSPGLSKITKVTFPSGVVEPVTGVEAACMTCHQGREAGASIAKATAGMEDDTPVKDLRFINPHYLTAAANWFGGPGKAGYQYPGKDYSGRFFHARPVASCVSCHEPHSLKVATETCATCHENPEPREIRIARQSYDGSGDLSVGIRSDIQANADLLMQMIADYATQVAGTPMVRESHYPYFFADANGDGLADKVDGKAVGYNAWTPRMLRAAFNWKLITADPGVYAHNPYYALELLYDSIEDLSGPLQVDVTSLNLVR